MFAIALVPIITGTGCAIDYSMATRIKAKLQGAADSASVASISVNSAGYNAAMSMTSNGSVTAGVTEANNIFSGNASGFAGSYTNLTKTSTVTKTGNKLASNVQFSADVPVTFMQLLGYRTLTVTGSSSSSTTLPLYLDFYLTLDVSGSMGLPSTTAEAQRMQSINPDNYRQYPTGLHAGLPLLAAEQRLHGLRHAGLPDQTITASAMRSRASARAATRVCSARRPAIPWASSCRPRSSPGLPNSLYSNLATAANCPTDGTDSCIQLRLDAVGYAVNQLFVTANNTAKVANQFRIGLYPFIRYLYSYFPLTSSINGSTTNPSTINYAAANLATLLDTNMNASLGSGGTHIDTALSSVNTLITTVGDGSAWNNTLPYVFLVTDGAQDPQVKGVPNGSWSGSNHATTIDPATSCTPLKNRGIIVSVLYIPYQPINPVNTSFAGDEDDYANWNIPNIPASLQNCASPGFFYTANTPADITAALNAMFNHAVQEARITN